MIAVSGLDMAAWDALAKASGVPLCVLLGGSVGPVKAYNSNGLWLQAAGGSGVEAIALRDEGGFTGLKLRLGRERPTRRSGRDRSDQALSATDMELMADFNQGLNCAEALQRCHMIDDRGPRLDRGADRLRQSRRLCAVGRRTKDADPDRREFLWPARSAQRAAEKGMRPRHAGLHAHRRRHRLAAGRRDRGSGRHSHVDPSVPGGRRSCDARDAKPRIGWNGRIGPILFYRSLTKFVTDCFTFPICLVLALNGMRKWSRLTGSICKAVLLFEPLVQKVG